MSTELLDIDAAIESAFSATEDPTDAEPAEEGTDGKKDYKGGEEKPAKKDDGEESVETDEKEGEEKDGEPTEKKATPEKKQNRADKRVEQLLKERYQLRKELEEARSRIKPDEPQPPKKPDAADFKFDPKDPESKADAQRRFDYAMGKYESDLKAHNEKVESRKAESEEKEQRRIDGEKSEYAARIEVGKKEYPDYDECFKNIADSFEMTEALHNTLLESKDPAGLLRFLGKNPLVAEKVLSMGNVRQAIKLAEIDVKLQYAKKANVKKASDAPAPPAKVAGSSGGKKDPAKMNAQEYHEYKNKQREKSK
jgi:hypothetical protein